MRFVIAAALALLVFSVAAVGTAGNARSCQSEWPNVQTSSGAAFAGVGECARYAGKGGELFSPSLVLSAEHVNVNEPFTATGTGFHPATVITLTIAITGQAPYLSHVGETNVNGDVTAFVTFTDCGGAPPYDLTLEMTDSFGVHASARIIVC